MVNKKYIEKKYTFPGGLSCDCFVIEYYMKQFKTNDITFKINGYKDILSLKNDLVHTELPMELISQFSIKESLLTTGNTDEEKILNYCVNNIGFLKTGLIKTV